MVKNHLVQNTHWDREWYFTAQDAMLLSDQVFTEAIDELRRNPKARFCLDGQSSIVDDYVEMNPERASDIKALMSEGRLDVGPWYTQTDALLVGAESIFRNMMVGVHDIRSKYGEPMLHGYLPDTFGFNAQMPAILNACGLDTFIGWRGIDYEKTGAPYFVWKSLGDQAVFAANMPHGYSMGVMPVEAIDRIDEFLEQKVDVEAEFVHRAAGNEDILMPVGMDQKNMVLDYDKFVEEFNKVGSYEYEVASYGSFMDLLRAKGGLPVYQGEFRDPCYSRVHRTIGSVRTQMKQRDFELENRLVRRVEPLLVLGRACGIEISNGALEHVWKKLLENQAHDSMGGCVSDNVAEDIFHRLKEAEEFASGIENLVAKRLADALCLSDNEVILFNTDAAPFSGDRTVHIVASGKNIAFPSSPYAVLEGERYYPPRDNVMCWGPTGLECTTEPAYYELDVRIHVDIPAFGYRVISFEESDVELEAPVAIDALSIANGDYAVSFEDGKLSLRCADGTVIEDFLAITDMGNDGDTYDFSPVEGEKELRLEFEGARALASSGGQSLIAEGSVALPCDLRDRGADGGKTDTVHFEVELSLGEAGMVEGAVRIDNTVLSHRMRLQVRSGVDSDLSFAQIQGGFMRRERVEAPADWADRYVEKPEPLEIFEKSVSVPSAAGTLTVFVEGVKEYEKLGDSLYLTLMSTTGQLGKPDLAWRPGRASGDTTFAGHIMMGTPLAQEIGKHEVTFAICVSEGDFDELSVARLSQKRLSIPMSYQRQSLNLFINRLDNKIWPEQYPREHVREASLLDLGEGALVSALMPSLYDVSSFVVRLVNPTAREIDIPDVLLVEGTQVTALEDELEAVAKVAPYSFVTVKLPMTVLSGREGGR